MDYIEGYQGHGTLGRDPQIASHALVLMIVGIPKRFKQPMAYYLSGDSVTADRLAVLIKEVCRSTSTQQCGSCHGQFSFGKIGCLFDALNANLPDLRRGKKTAIASTSGSLWQTRSLSKRHLEEEDGSDGSWDSDFDVRPVVKVARVTTRSITARRGKSVATRGRMTAGEMKEVKRAELAEREVET
ncbi:Uncharacterized protein OBRU01_03580 [Operophtera brumata]|uniref:Transposable element P transposase-like RNase H domain-containing protein n=1 Tax=Operophtera brumata TaxID=104452 RepID=A0A0L7LPX4_OPEBR|nr:Uncharacterized protein OBRU01_03580 [Operophtera brumata]